MKKVMVAQLKARLSAYLAEVRRGASVVVCDRATPIALLIPYESVEDEGFEVVPASARMPKPVKAQLVRLKQPIDVVRVLREDRDAR